MDGSYSSCFSLVSLYHTFLRRSFSAAGLSSQTVTLTLDDDAAAATTTLHIWGPKSPSKSKPSLLLIHGFGVGAVWQWRHQVAALSSRFDLYVPDLLFFGASSTASPERSEAFQAACLGRLMEIRGVRRYSVMGTSYGGFVAYRMAEMFGEERVEKVVIASSAVNMVRADNDALLRRGKAEKMEDLMLPASASQLRALLGLALFRAPARAPNFLLNDVIDKLYLENRKEKMELLDGLTIGKDDTPKLAPLKQDVLIVWGEHDQIFLVEKATQLKELLGEKARLKIIKNTSHAPQFENPVKFNKIVKNFLCGSTV